MSLLNMKLDPSCLASILTVKCEQIMNELRIKYKKVTQDTTILLFLKMSSACHRLRFVGLYKKYNRKQPLGWTKTAVC